MDYKNGDFWDGLWKQAMENAEGLTAKQVLEVFRDVSDDVYESGIDEVYEQLIINGANIDSINFDVIWLSNMVIRLKKLAQKGEDATR